MLPLLLLTLLAPALVVGNDAERLATSALIEESDLTEAGDPGPSSRLSGQYIARPGHFKSTVFVSYSMAFRDSQTDQYWKGIARCSGIILRPRWVLTAASCLPCPYHYNKANPGERYEEYTEVDADITRLYVRATCDEDNMLIYKAGCPKYLIQRYFEHPNAVISINTCSNPTVLTNRYDVDVALLKTADEIVFDDYVGSIGLSKRRLPYREDRCIAQGFGNRINGSNCQSIQDFARDNNFLRYGNVTAGNSEYCRDLLTESELDGLHNDSYVCAYNYDRPLAMAFVGDSGAALLCRTEGGDFEAVGVLARAAEPKANVRNRKKLPCGFVDTAILYTSVGYIDEWVEEMWKQHDPLPDVS